MDPIESKVRKFLGENFFVEDSGELREDMSFMQTQLIDSTGFIELIAFVEDEFGVEVREEDMVPENLDSIANIKRFVTRKRSESKAA